MVHQVSELKDINYEELSRKDDNNTNRAWIRKAFGVETMKELWQNIFEYAEDTISYETAFEKYSKTVAGIEEHSHKVTKLEIEKRNSNPSNLNDS